MKTIIVEDRFREMFDYLPVMANSEAVVFKPIFKTGDKFELMNFLKNSENADSPYPLIWLNKPFPEQHLKNKVRLDNISFILAIETNSILTYEERIELTFKPVLIPLLDNMKDLFTKSNILDWNREVEVWKFANYSGDEDDGLKTQTGDIWDALKITFDCTINNSCLRQINF